MKKITLVTILLLVYVNFYSQKTNPSERCASDVLNRKLIAENTDFSSKMMDFEKAVKINKLTARINGSKYIIPVVVHVMHKGEDIGVGTNITDNDIFFKIKAMNEEYRKILDSRGDGAGVDVDIEFALAVRDPTDNPTNGIVRFNMSNYVNYMNNGINSSQTEGMSDADLKMLSFWDSTKYYNIWIVSEIDNNNGGVGTQGYAYYAAQHGTAVDGAVIISNSFKDVNSTTEVHEIGHALNLYHTFEGDNNGTTCPSGNGDFCDDTPAHKRGINDCSILGTNTCDGNSSNLLFVNNYMSYSYDNCRNMFTDDQKNRAITALTTIRRSLLEEQGNNRLVPIGQPLSDFIASCQIINVGEKVDFLNISGGVPNNYLDRDSWVGMSFEWKFINGTTTLTSTNQNPVITFLEPGNYTVTLKVTNSLGTNLKIETNYIHVVDPAIKMVVPISTNIGNYGYTINKVYFNEIENITDAYKNIAYTDFSSLKKTFVTAGKEYPLEVVTHAGTSSSYSEYHAIYIDYNNDGIFEETERISEGIALTNQNKKFLEQVTIPLNSIRNTLLRMRVAGNGKIPIDNDLINAKVDYWAGDVEDYGIYILDPKLKPNAEFTVLKSSIISGEDVVFTDTSTNEPTSWVWKISKDGNVKFSSVLQNPVFTLTESGMYTVELVVSNANGSDTKIFNDMIIVSDRPLGTLDFNQTTSIYYPNPVINNLFVSNDLYTIKKIEAYNSLGQLILTTNFNSNKVDIDFSRLEKGIYFISCYFDEKKEFFKIIKK